MFGVGIRVLELGGEEGRATGFVGTDPLRLTVSFEGGLGGYEADDLLIEGKVEGKRELGMAEGGGTSFSHFACRAAWPNHVGASRRCGKG